MSGRDHGGLHRDVACPFCGLLCDDLTIDRSGDRLALRGVACDRARAGFERPLPAATPLIDGREASLENAVAEAARLMTASRLPLFAGLGADVEGLRGLTALADRCGGVLDHMHGDALFRNLTVMTERGWMVTTLSEVRNRADLVLIVGPDPRASYPRFFERCLGSSETLFSEHGLTRRILRLGPATADTDGEVSLIPCDLARLPEAIALLRALLHDPERSISGAEGLPLGTLRELARALPEASYGVVVWAVSGFEEPWGALAVEGLSELVRALNRTTRFSGLPLSGNDNLVGANNVATWQSGLPLRTAFARGRPEHDPLRFATRRLLDDGEADLLIWVSAFQPAPPPARPASLPTIVLATPGDARPEADLVIPVGTPGLDHAGRAFRSDSVIALPLSALRDSALPSVAEVCAALSNALEIEAAAS